MMSDIKTIEGSLRGKRYKPDMQFDFVISIPEKEVGEYALLVDHDGQSDAKKICRLLRLIREGNDKVV